MVLITFSTMKINIRNKRVCIIKPIVCVRVLFASFIFVNKLPFLICCFVLSFSLAFPFCAFLIFVQVLKLLTSFLKWFLRIDVPTVLLSRVQQHLRI